LQIEKFGGLSWLFPTLFHFGSVFATHSLVDTGDVLFTFEKMPQGNGGGTVLAERSVRMRLR